MPVFRQIAQLGQPVLRLQARSIDAPFDPKLRPLIDDLLVTVSDANGVGIAAPQVYESLALFIVASRPNSRYPQAPLMEPTVVINPEIVWHSEETEPGWEGCLSIPGIRGLVPRYRRIGVRYRDLGGQLCEAEYVDFIARVFQHEFDHLQGIVFLDRVVSTRDLVTEKEYLRIVAGISP